MRSSLSGRTPQKSQVKNNPFDFRDLLSALASEVSVRHAYPAASTSSSHQTTTPAHHDAAHPFKNPCSTPSPCAVKSAPDGQDRPPIGSPNFARLCASYVANATSALMQSTPIAHKTASCIVGTPFGHDLRKTPAYPGWWKTANPQPPHGFLPA